MQRRMFSSIVLAAGAFNLAMLVAATPVNAQVSCVQNGCCPPAEDEESVCNYGPCPCEARGTLFQWSYGTSFGGGPPGPDEPLVSDRPDFTEASVTVGRGVAQLEMGYTYIYDSENGESIRTHSYPETLLRVGVLAEWLELRFGWSYTDERTRTAGTEMNITGGEDLYLGTKIALTPQEGILPEMAIIPQMFVPTGHDDLTADEVLPGVNWLYGWDINDFLTCGGSTQFNRVRDDVTAGAYTEWAQSFTIGYSLTDQLGAYTEYFGLYPHSADTARPEHYFDGGFTFLVTNNLQLDVRAGVGLNRNADDYFVGSGAVMRF